MNLSREEFLSRRKEGIGGSDVAAILGISKFKKTAIDIWRDKTSDTISEDPEVMRDFFDKRSHDEEFVAHLYEKHTGYKVRRRNSLLVCKEYPCLRGNIDREILGDKRGLGILECKSVSPVTYRNIEMHGLPADYSCQIHHYLKSGNGKYKWAAFAIMDCVSAKLLTFEIITDEEFENQIGESCQHFWDSYVVPKVCPPFDEEKESSSSITIPKDFSGTVENLNDDGILADSIMRYQEALDMELEAMQLVESLRDDIESQMRDHEAAECAGHRIYYRASTRSSFDTTRFKTDNPELYAKYTKQTQTKRTLRVFPINNKDF